MSLLLEAALEASVILLLALAVMPLLRRQPAALRHAVLAVALACCVLAPAAAPVLPAWTPPGRLGSIVSGETALELAIPATRPAAVDRPDGATDSQTRSATIVPMLAMVWAAGTAIALGAMVLGLWRVRRLARASRPLDEGPWVDHANALCSQSRQRRRVALLQSVHPSLLVTWGLVRPTILLPAAAASWPDDRIRVTLCHELAHVRRRDWLALVGGEMLKAAYWFNPLVWLVCARLREESEQACDDEVIAAGVRGADYAAHLVRIARELKPPPAWIPAHGIARSSKFERRVRAMLDPHLNRRPVSRATYAALAITLVAASVSIAAVQQRLSVVSGSIADPMNGVLPGVTLVLTNVQNESKFEVRTDASGRYEFVGVPAGEYLFEARLPGFSTFKGKVTVTTDVQRDLTMELGSVQETITISFGPPAAASAVVAAAPVARARRPLPDCGSAPRADSRPFVGGNLRAPLKLLDVRPIYPPHLGATGTGGAVVLKGLIGIDGRVEDLKVVSTAHEDLASAAVDAVSRWEFAATLLNCTPIATAITINVNFEPNRR